MMDYCEVVVRSSFQDFLQVLEADIQHANELAASLPGGKSGASLQIKLVYNHLAPFFMFLLQWMNKSSTCLLSTYLVLFHVFSDGKPNISTCGRKATIREFYTVILPSLQHLHGNLSEMDITREVHSSDKMIRKRVDEKRKLSDLDMEQEDECGICLETCTKMVLPNCCHAMCINCYHDWNSRSESCPFCRGSLKRVNSRDLWVLTGTSDVVDTQRVVKEDMLRFHLYINSLPRDIPDARFFMYYEYLI